MMEKIATAYGDLKRRKTIPDFSNWKNHAAFETDFARLEKDLRASVGK
jgi:hypothetical protein